MNREGRERPRDRDEEEHQQPVIGAAALRDRHDRKPGDTGLHRHSLTNEARDHRGERIDEIAGQDAGDEAERGQDEHRGERPAVGLARVSGGEHARAAEEAHPIGFDEAGGRERCRQRQERADSGHQQLQSP